MKTERSEPKPSKIEDWILGVALLMCALAFFGYIGLMAAYPIFHSFPRYQIKATGEYRTLETLTELPISSGGKIKVYSLCKMVDGQWPKCDLYSQEQVIEAGKGPYAQEIRKDMPFVF